MSTTSELVGHAHGFIDVTLPPLPPGPLVVDTNIACQLTRNFFPRATFILTVSSGMGSDEGSVKATLNAWSGYAPVTCTFVWLFENVFLMVCSNDAGNAVDPDELWFTVERFARVGI